MSPACVGDTPVAPNDSGTPDSGAPDSSAPDTGADAGGDAGCDAGLTACGTACVNTDDDTANCGRCAHDCVGGACQSGVCQPITVAAGAGAISNTPPMATDGTNVCWAVNTSTGTIFCVPTSATSTTPVTVASNVDKPAAIAVAAGKVFWGAHIAGNGIALFSGDPSVPNSPTALNPTLVPTTGDYYDLYHLVSNSAGTHLFVSYEHTHASTYTLLIDDADYVAQSRTNVVSLSGTTAIAQRTRGLSTDDKGLFFSYNDGVANSGIVERVPTAGGAATTFSSTEDNPKLAVIDSGYVYWTAGALVIRRAPIAASPTASDVATASNNPVGLVATPTHVVWTEINGTGLAMAPAAGGAASTYVAGSLGDKPSALVRDAVAIYWIDQADGSLHKVAVP